MSDEDIKTLIEIASKYKFYQWNSIIVEINRSFEHKTGTITLDDTDKIRLSKYLCEFNQDQ